MLLCPNCHGMTKVGALTEADQRKMKAAPFNIQRGFVEGMLMINSHVYALLAGTVDFIGAGFKLIVDDEPLLRLDSDIEGRLMVSVDLRDSKDQLLAAIYRNEWVAGDPMPWDIEFSHNRLTVRQRAGTISLTIEARGAFVNIGGRLQRAGQVFELGKELIRFNGVVQNCGFAHIGLAGACLVVDTKAGNLSMRAYPRIGSFLIISGSDRELRLSKGIVAYRRLVADAVLSRNDSCPCDSGLKVKKCCLNPRAA